MLAKNTKTTAPLYDLIISINKNLTKTDNKTTLKIVNTPWGSPARANFFFKPAFKGADHEKNVAFKHYRRYRYLPNS
jgi:hypothetical protein